MTPEQEQTAKAAWEARKGATSYEDDLMGPETSPELQSEIDELLSHDPLKPTSQGLEELQHQQELADEGAKPYQWIKPEWYADEEARKGRLIDHATFIKILREECHLICTYSEPFEMNGGLALALWVAPKEGAEMVMGAWVQHGWMIEYEIMHFDPHGVPLNPKYRGWRTVILQLIEKGLLKEEVATKAFGEAKGSPAWLYNSQLHGFRNRPRQETAAMREVLEVQPEPEPMPEPDVRCPVCHRKAPAHNLDCEKYVM